MGGPHTEDELRLFLTNMFSDKYILPLPLGLRHFVASMISRKRAPSSWKKYQMIGGTPIICHTQMAGTALEESTGIKVYPAYSYTKPYIGEVMKTMVEEGCDHITVVTMYPQESRTTTTSVFEDVDKAARKFKTVTIDKVGDYSSHPAFLNYWNTLIEEHIAREGVENPLILYTAHSVPVYSVKKGDKYPDLVKTMAANLHKINGRRYEVAFQSRVGPVKWVGPDTDEHLKHLVEGGERKVVIVPLSFTTECLETVLDLDVNLPAPYRNGNQLDHFSRVIIPPAHPLFIQTLKLITNE